LTRTSRKYLPDNVPAVKAWLDSLQRFDAFDTWLVGLEEPGSGLSIEGLRHVDSVTRRLEGLKASGLLAVRSVTNVDSLREGADGAVNPELLVAALPDRPGQSRHLEETRLGDREVLGALVSRDLRGYALVIPRPIRGKDAAEVAQLIERTAEAERGPLKAHYLGAPFSLRFRFKHLVAQLPWLAPCSCCSCSRSSCAGTGRPGWSCSCSPRQEARCIWVGRVDAAVWQELTPSSGNVALGLFVLTGATVARLWSTRARRRSRERRCDFHLPPVCPLPRDGRHRRACPGARFGCCARRKTCSRPR